MGNRGRAHGGQNGVVCRVIRKDLTAVHSATRVHRLHDVSASILHPVDNLQIDHMRTQPILGIAYITDSL
jgi:hypothetical protein